MHDRCSANERPEEAHHEVNGVIRRQDAEVTNARRKRIDRSERNALFEVILVRQQAAFGTAAGAGRIDDASHVLACARNEGWFAAPLELFPSLGASEIGARGRFGHQDSLHIRGCGAALGHAQLAPDWIFGDQGICARMLEQFPLFVRRELVVQRNQHAASKKNGISGNQPLGLIRHDDAGAMARAEARVFERLRERVGARFEVPVGEALFFSLAVGFNEADFV